MRRYRTQILIPTDRTVVMQLPMNLPEGWATVTVLVHEAEEADHLEAEADRQDIEWWDEFDEDAADLSEPS